jgi:hypothetical protein
MHGERFERLNSSGHGEGRPWSPAPARFPAVAGVHGSPQQTYPRVVAGLVPYCWPISENSSVRAS